MIIVLYFSHEMGQRLRTPMEIPLTLLLLPLTLLPSLKLLL